MTTTTGASVLVLNASYEPLHRVSVQHAIRMLVREVAVIEEEAETMFGAMRMPKVLRLVRYVAMRWKYRRGTICSKQAILRRDKNTCGYCGGKGNTVDHILPKSRGGPLTWENSVTACAPCNVKKANRTPEEAGMILRIIPTRPV